MIEMLSSLGDFDKKPTAPTLSPRQMMGFKQWLSIEHATLEHELLVTRYEARRDFVRFDRVTDQDTEGEEEEEFVESYLWLCFKIVRLEHELRQVQPVYETVADGIEEEAVEVDMSQLPARLLWERYKSL